ncbi:hypothetical protein EW146_g10435, partial [Bondarzewia mesenterica]
MTVVSATYQASAFVHEKGKTHHGGDGARMHPSARFRTKNPLHSLHYEDNEGTRTTRTTITVTAKTASMTIAGQGISNRRHQCFQPTRRDGNVDVHHNMLLPPTHIPIVLFLAHCHTAIDRSTSSFRAHRHPWMGTMGLWGAPIKCSTRPVRRSPSSAPFVSQLFACKDLPPPSAPPSAPTPRLDHFVTYALHRTRLHVSVTFAALFLLQRLKAHFSAAKGSSGHRLFISAFMIASKIICDDTYSNKSWSIVSQGMFALREINQMEHEMCSYLEWQLNVEPQVLRHFKAKVRRNFADLGPYPLIVLPQLSPSPSRTHTRPPHPHLLRSRPSAHARPHPLPRPPPHPLPRPPPR